MTESINFNPLKYRGWGLRQNNFETEIFTEFNFDKQKWNHQWLTTNISKNIKENFFEADNTRENGFFMILDCLNAPQHQRASEIHTHLDIYCDPFIDKYYRVEPNWQPGVVNKIFEKDGFAAKYGASIENKNHNFVFQDTHVVFDGKPNFAISYTNLVDLNKKNNYNKDATYAQKTMYEYEICDDLEDWYIKQSPNFCARTMGELLRLIIDWDLAYHHFNNRENIAYICHKIMGSINMPIEIYNEIVKLMPESVVVRYIKGYTNALELGDRPKTPESVIEWLNEKYWELRYTYNDEFHNTGDVDDNHYYNRIFM